MSGKGSTSKNGFQLLAVEITALEKNKILVVP